MRFKRPVLKFALDEGVPNAVGRMLKEAGHKVLFLNKLLTRGTTDPLVCAFAQLNQAILVATDNDMRQIARGYGIGNNRYKTLSLIKLSCNETMAADRVLASLSLIEHEWFIASSVDGRRIYIDVSESVIKSYL